jgi:hypothetical protein
MREKLRYKPGLAEAKEAGSVNKVTFSGDKPNGAIGRPDGLTVWWGLYSIEP